MSARWGALARLGLRLEAPAGAWTTAAILFALYVATMARDLTFYDSPELALVAHQLGVGHPIGMPLHTLLGFAFARLAPTPHLGLSAMSALFGALCALPAWSLADRLAIAPAKWPRALVFVGLGASLVAWEPSTRVEVYTLAVFAALWGLARTAGGRAGFAAGVAFGLAASSHAVIAIAHALAAVPRALSRADAAPPPADAEAQAQQGPAVGMLAREAAPPPRRGSLAGLVLGGLAGLAPYALLPIAAADPARFAWGAPRDAAALLAYLWGSDYRHNQGIGLAALGEHLGALAWWGLSQAVLPLALVGAAAFVALGHGRARLGWAVVIAGALTTLFVAANVVFHPDVPDYRGYLLGPLWLSGVGLAALAERLHARGGRFVAYGAALAALPLVALAPAGQHLLQVRDDPSLARALGEAALREAPEGAILVVEADHHVAPLLYLQEVESQRPDVVLIAMGLASSGWYWEHVAARHPGLADFALVGPGGREARVRRFLAAQRPRRPLFESSALAIALGHVPCGVGALVWAAEPGAAAGACGDPGPDATTRAIASAAPFRSESLEVAARVGEARGEALWRLGHGQPALDALLAGLPPSGVGPPAVEIGARAAPLVGALPAWSRPAAIHDPARNVALAGLLADAAGRPDHAARLLERARALGLSDARR
ncbi:MAG: DUF2723 domain-containing protein [Sandaracinaceae bacterium]|nr:DUF2723 domain-containing protein [Sandaracinaceae bacterium]